MYGRSFPTFLLVWSHVAAALLGLYFDDLMTHPLHELRVFVLRLPWSSGLLAWRASLFIPGSALRAFAFGFAFDVVGSERTCRVGGRGRVWCT